jgi:hypothetical protein
MRSCSPYTPSLFPPFGRGAGDVRKHGLRRSVSYSVALHSADPFREGPVDRAW